MPLKRLDWTVCTGARKGHQLQFPSVWKSAAAFDCGSSSGGGEIVKTLSWWIWLYISRNTSSIGQKDLVVSRRKRPELNDEEIILAITVIKTNSQHLKMNTSPFFFLEHCFPVCVCVVFAFALRYKTEASWPLGNTFADRFLSTDSGETIKQCICTALVCLVGIKGICRIKQIKQLTLLIHINTIVIL